MSHTLDPAVAALLAEFSRAHPRVFSAHRPPLRIGIRADLVAEHPRYDPETIGLAIGAWTSDIPYLANVASRQPRHSLDGQEVAAVSPQDAWAARLALMARLRVDRQRIAPAQFDPRRHTPELAQARTLRNAVLRPGEDAPLTEAGQAFILTLLQRLRPVPEGATVLVRGVEQGRFILRHPGGQDEVIPILRCIGPAPDRRAPEPERLPQHAEPAAVTIELNVPSARLGAVFPVSALARVGIRPPNGSTEVTLTLVSGAVELTATVAAKAVRKVLLAEPDRPAEVQGRLAADSRIEGAGLALKAPRFIPVEGEPAVAKTPPAPLQAPARAYGANTLRLQSTPALSREA